MIVQGTRKRKVPDQITRLPSGIVVRFAVQLQGDIAERAKQLGFSNDLPIGESLLPPPIGPVTQRNAEGHEIIHKDKPKETVYYQRDWHWEEWHGPYNRVEQSKIVDVPVERYPRTFIPPPSVELAIAEGPDGAKYLISPPIKVGEDADDVIIHRMNVMLEYFEHCYVLTGKNLKAIRIPTLTKMNWKILPPGKYPWEKMKPEVEPILEQASEGTRVVIEHRLERITQHDPEFVAIGHAGFSGYLIFGFPIKNLFVLESVHTGNATYIFEEDWAELSQLTKAEILADALHKDRFIHRDGWDQQIRSLLS